jgi:hypothetical protein
VQQDFGSVFQPYSCIPLGFIIQIPIQPEDTVGIVLKVPELKDQGPVPASNHGYAAPFQRHVEQREADTKADGGLSKKIETNSEYILQISCSAMYFLLLSKSQAHLRLSGEIP